MSVNFSSRFKRSEVKSSAHFEKRKLGRIVSKLSLVDRLGILEELDDEDESMIQRKLRNLDRQDSGLSTVSTLSDVTNISDTETTEAELSDSLLGGTKVCTMYILKIYMWHKSDVWIKEVLAINFFKDTFSCRVYYLTQI